MIYLEEYNKTLPAAAIPIHNNSYMIQFFKKGTKPKFVNHEDNVEKMGKRFFF